MKDSGIKWIGSIPDTWNVIKVKYNCSLKGRIGWQGLTTDEYIEEGPFLITGTDFNVNDGVINWESCVHVSEWRYDQAPEIQVHNGDLLITKDGTVGKVAIVTNMMDKTTLNSGVMVIRPTEDTYETRFLYYVLRSEEFWKWFNYINAGNTTISHLYQHDLNHFYFAITDKIEQRAIIDFLDKKCQQADIIINKVREQVCLLEKVKSSLITECVTGKAIALHGKIIKKRMKYVFQVKDGTHDTPDYVEESENTYPLVTSKCLNGYNIDFSCAPHISKEDHLKINIRSDVKKGDLIMPMIGTIGSPVIVETERPFSIKNVALFKSTQNRNLDKYIWYFFYSKLMEAQFEQSVRSGVQQFLSLSIIKNLVLEIPEMQKDIDAIVCYLDKKCETLDRIIEKKRTELSILEEQKKSLINEYITGKKRVKGYE